jgi:tetratricopeptide (TPR) repeat protein
VLSVPQRTQQRLTLALLFVVPVGAVALLSWFAWRSPQSRFLPLDGAARWIIYPVPPRIELVLDAPEQHAIFRRTFDLPSTPNEARLMVRAFSGCSITVNGKPVSLSEVKQWQDLRTAEVGGQLHSGSNELVAVVANEFGPPALWLALEGPGWSVASDGQWTASLDGAVECSAQLADEPLPVRPGNPAAGGNRPIESLQAIWPVLVTFALISAALLAVTRVMARRTEPLRLFGFRTTPLTVGLLAAMLLWILLFGHNTLGVPLFPSGFDARAHQRYVQYILDHKALPLADEGWEAHHPPLYYLLAAIILWVFRLSAGDPGALVVFRLMGLAAGLVELALIAGCMQLLFPDQPRRQLAGLGLAAFLPAHIYVAHHITNEVLVMTLGTAALYVCLLLLSTERSGVRWYALLGLCLGAAILAKVTALVIAGVVFLVLAGRHLARREGPLTWCRGVGVAVAVTLLTSGWYFARVWSHFGTPLVGCYDPISGYRWWQYPGVGTLAFLFSFGQALSNPFHSALHSVPDGIYSTLWGDGSCGGMPFWTYRPPWNYDLMAAGFLLALVPSLVIVGGLTATIVAWLRRPQAQQYLLLGIAGGLAVATIYHLLRFPYHCHAKAFYELTGLVTLCAFAGVGVDLLTKWGRLPAAVLTILLGTWACTSYASLWIDRNSATTWNWAGQEYLYTNQTAEAGNCFRKALTSDAHFPPALLNAACQLLQSPRREIARQMLHEVLRLEPFNAEALCGLVLFFPDERQGDDTVQKLRRASELAPDHPLLHFVMGGILMERYRLPEAIAAYRESLRITPTNAPATHANLGLALARTGSMEEAEAQYRQALRLRPNQTNWAQDLATIQATHKPPTRTVPYPAAPPPEFKL